MQITVEVAEERVADLVRQRIAELFSDDARFRETGVRDLLRKIVDEAATTAVRSARDAIAAELPGVVMTVRHCTPNAEAQGRPPLGEDVP